MSLTLRYKQIQKKLNVSATGVIDAPTLTAIETFLQMPNSNASITNRIIAIQQFLKITPAVGNFGPITTSKIEGLLIPIVPPLRPFTNLVVSLKSLKFIVIEEVSSEASYSSKYKFPTWPKGQSGVTIGIGYD